MAITYWHVDLNLSGSGNTGVDWANAYEGVAGFLTACAKTGGTPDVVFVKDSADRSTGDINITWGGTLGNPIIVLGVKSATTNEGAAITTADLVDGLRAGDGTRAYDNTPPQLSTSASNAYQIQFGLGFAYVYGINFFSRGTISVNYSIGHAGTMFEECHVQPGYGATAGVQLMQTGGGSRHNNRLHMRHCKVTFGYNHNTCGLIPSIYGNWIFDKCDIQGPSNADAVITGSVSGHCRFESCDLSTGFDEYLCEPASSETGTLIDFIHCKLNASVAVINGVSPGSEYRYRLYNCGDDPGSPLGSGESFQELDDYHMHGSTVEETTAVRTGGADDDATGAYSLAMTPIAAYTLENYWPLRSPFIDLWVEGDGTSKTVTVYIANSGAADYYDDDVWLEVFAPAEDGNRMRDFYTTQADLLATPAVVTDDTGSTWGTGANNPQKLEVTIAPDYSGFIRCRVCFAKYFASSPETLFVDPLPVIS